MRRGGVYYVRARVPQDLVEVIGKSEIRRSLKTSDPAEGRRRLRAVASEIQAEFDAARRRSAASATGTLQPVANSDVPTPAKLRAIVREWFAGEERKAAEAELTVELHDPEDRLEALDYDAGVLADPADPRVMAGVQTTAKQLIQAHSLGVAEGSAAYHQLAELVRRALLEGINRATRRARGDYGAVAHDPLFAVPGTSTGAGSAAGQPDISFGRLIELYVADPGRRVAPKTAGTRAGMFALLTAFIGANKPARQITRADACQLQDSLLALPAYAAKRFPGVSIAEVVERAKAAGLKPMAPATVNAHLGLLSEVLRWAMREGHLDRNVAEGLQVPDAPAKDKRRSFTSAELASFFHGALYPPGPVRSGFQWVPLLCLYQGLRLAEACGLGVDDFKLVDGVACIHVRPDAERGRRLKTASAERIVPLHPALAGLGFVEHVAEQRRRGAARIFDDLEPGPRGDYGATSKRLNRAIRAAGIADRKIVVHALRHAFTDAAKEAGIPLERLRQVMGWTSGGMEAVYGSGLSARTLFAEISKVSYPLDLTHVLSSRQE